MNKNEVKYTFLLDEKCKRKLAVLAAKKGVLLSKYIREMIKDHLANNKEL